MSERGLSERWPAEVDAVTPIRHAVIAFARAAGASQRLVDDIALAATEAATNAVLHGFGERNGNGDGPGTITVSARVVDHALHLDIADDGDGISPHLEHDSLGMGLSIIARLADEVRIAAGPAGGTRIVMRFSLASG